MASAYKNKSKGNWEPRLAKLQKLRDTLEFKKILEDTILVKRGVLKLSIEEIIVYSEFLAAQVMIEIDRWYVDKNVSAGMRARKYSVLVGELHKEFRKLSV